MQNLLKQYSLPLVRMGFCHVTSAVVYSNLGHMWISIAIPFIIREAELTKMHPVVSYIHVLTVCTLQCYTM